MIYTFKRPKCGSKILPTITLPIKSKRLEGPSLHKELAFPVTGQRCAAGTRSRKETITKFVYDTKTQPRFHNSLPFINQFPQHRFQSVLTSKENCFNIHQKVHTYHPEPQLTPTWTSDLNNTCSGRGPEHRQQRFGQSYYHLPIQTVDRPTATNRFHENITHMTRCTPLYQSHR